MEALNKLIDPAPDRTIVTSRIMNASQELVFKAWSDPAHLKNWWGPKGFTNTFSEFDFREGGKWVFVMHGPDKGNYPNESVFVKIQRLGFLALDHISAPEFQVQATFKKMADDQTEVIFKQVFKTAEECNKLRSFVTGKNEENMDRLEAELKAMQL